jgi:hypothetical protein
MKKEWVCWTLSKDQIDIAAKAVGLNPKRLTRKDYRNVVRKFNEEFKKVNKQWALILEDAIEREVR